MDYIHVILRYMDYLSIVEADVSVRNQDGKTALELAKNPQCAALLQRAGKPSN